MALKVASVADTGTASSTMSAPETASRAEGASTSITPIWRARSGQWEYYFYIDLEGHPSQPNVAAALKDLQALCAFYKVLGTYPLGE